MKTRNKIIMRGLLLGLILSLINPAFAQRESNHRQEQHPNNRQAHDSRPKQAPSFHTQGHRPHQRDARSHELYTRPHDHSATRSNDHGIPRFHERNTYIRDHDVHHFNGRREIFRFHERDKNVWRTGAWRHDWHGGRLGWYWVVGGIFYYYNTPIYPYPSPYVPNVAVSIPTSSIQATNFPSVWYYCEASNNYYPYVAQCTSGWVQVSATPPTINN